MVWVNTSPLVKTYTLEEFWELPEPPDHSKIELIAGVLFMTPPPEKPHGKAVSRILLLLSNFLIETADKGRYYVPRHAIALSPNTWLEPDLFYVSAETEAQSTTRYHTTADLVVEVISPGSAIYDRNTKADTYIALGVKELWLVDELSGIIEVRILKGDSYQSHVFERYDRLISTILPGFGFKVGEIFED
ncbi:MAG TPA: Uma2 family endonuclease [Pyrinomonadaceae bacterium]|nr:Uma2 family endonuclease [Pyrinomonadaceae bacterium]